MSETRTAFRPPIGISDFRQLREQNATYVDKTGLVTELLASTAQVVLLPRPRRFGKTLNLSMLRYFFDRRGPDPTPLFCDLAVWGDEAARAHLQRYPVIFVTFKDVKYDTWEACVEAVGWAVAEAFAAHAEVLERGGLGERDAADFDAVYRRTASPVQLAESLRALSGYLHAYYGEPVVILIDEYDTPIHAAWQHGYYDSAITFFRNLLSGALKDNVHLFRGVITGILRIAKESIFSGLNNLAVYPVTQSELATAFGFTSDEVAWLATLAGAEDRLEDLRAWYDGYRFGGQVIYNPWSVLCFLASRDRRFEPWWATTSSNDLVRRLLGSGALAAVDLEVLLARGSVTKHLEETVVLRDLYRRPEVIWSLLLHAGYLRVDALEGDLRRQATLSLPNLEVEAIFRLSFAEWMEAGLGGHDRVMTILRALLAGDVADFGRGLQELLTDALSYHDLGGQGAERVFQAFIVGLLVQLGSQYDVRSNRESGLGRADVLILPRQAKQPGVVMELKTMPEGEAPEQALDAALRQIHARGYAAEVRSRGAEPIHLLAVAFDGKRVHLRRETVE